MSQECLGVSDMVPTTQTSACSFRDLVLGAEPPPSGPPVGFGSSSVVHVNLELMEMLAVT